MKIDYCYHTHTARCGHARGLDEEYILSAIKKGIKVLGFSDHVFLPGISLYGNRGSFEQLDEYINSINKLKEKYKDQIEIHVGFEAEYLPEYLEYYKSLLDSKKIEYLILGQHCLKKDNKLHFYSQIKDSKEAAQLYTEHLIEGIHTGLFKYVCHPDFFAWFYKNNSKLFEELSRKIIEAAISKDIPLEINLGGRRKKELDKHHIYASENFFKLVSEYENAKVIVGFDAHSPNDFYVSDEEFAEYVIEKYHLTHVDRIKM